MFWESICLGHIWIIKSFDHGQLASGHAGVMMSCKLFFVCWRPWLIIAIAQTIEWWHQHIYWRISVCVHESWVTARKKDKWLNKHTYVSCSMASSDWIIQQRHQRQQMYYQRVVTEVATSQTDNRALENSRQHECRLQTGDQRLFPGAGGRSDNASTGRTCAQ